MAGDFTLDGNTFTNMGSLFRMLAFKIEVSEPIFKGQGYVKKGSSDSDVARAVASLKQKVSLDLAERARSTIHDWLAPGGDQEIEIGFTGKSAEAIAVASRKQGDTMIGYVYEKIGGHNKTIRQGQRAYGTGSRKRTHALKQRFDYIRSWVEKKVSQSSIDSEGGSDIKQSVEQRTYAVIGSIVKHGTSVAYPSYGFTDGHPYWDYFRFYVRNRMRTSFQAYLGKMTNGKMPELEAVKYVYFGYLATKLGHGKTATMNGIGSGTMKV